ncbi:hypothetical protein CDES_07720 [Corynebacterium deserti GIMN1.010]|uniref:Helix-turn-helix domain-containing protein n=1 Tax=Corynebacterium deserti GIMN1.010 TaxID=931089 RepID=A0A0M4CJJ4_9CORY|nr:helix-turn-helix domain-containing protein [Corynebacterium deserti]ALC05951.1 hypothetical protein CDES_07720 [Corynebacterium deserti GIMN1.010]
MSRQLTYSAGEAAELLGYAKSTLLKHAYAGALEPPFRWHRAGEAVRFVKIDIDRHLGIEEAA